MRRHSLQPESAKSPSPKPAARQVDYMSMIPSSQASILNLAQFLLQESGESEDEPSKLVSAPGENAWERRDVVIEFWSSHDHMLGSSR